MNEHGRARQVKDDNPRTETEELNHDQESITSIVDLDGSIPGDAVQVNSFLPKLFTGIRLHFWNFEVMQT